MSLPERIEKVIRAWPQWSPHERKHMDAIVEEIMNHVRNGTGNGFIRSWCNRVLVPLIPGMVVRELDSISRSAGQCRQNTSSGSRAVSTAKRRRGS